MRPVLSDDEAAGLAREVLDVDGVTLEPITVGYGSVSWRVESARGRCVLKVGPLESAAKWASGRVGQGLATKAGVPTQRALHFSVRDDRVVRAFEWVDSKMEDKEWMIRTFTKGLLDEVSLVLVGAVPDTELMSGSLRTAGLKLNVRDPLMSKEAAGAILLKLHLGEVDLADALAEIKAAPEQKVDPAPKAAVAYPDAPATDTPVQTPDAAAATGDHTCRVHDGAPGGVGTAARRAPAA